MKKRFKYILIGIALVSLSVSVEAGLTHFPHGLASGTASQSSGASLTLSDGSLYVSSNTEIDGACRIDSNLTVAGTITQTGAVAITGALTQTGAVTVVGAVGISGGNLIFTTGGYVVRIASANVDGANGFKFESNNSTATLTLKGTTRVVGTMNTAGVSNTGTLANTGALTNTGAVTVTGALAVGSGNVSVETGNNSYTVKIASANTNQANGFVFESNSSTATLSFQGTSRIVSPTISGTLTSVGISNTGTLTNTGAVTVGSGDLTLVTGNNEYVVRIASANTTTANGVVFESNISTLTMRFQGTTRIVSPTISGTLTSVGIGNTGALTNTGVLTNTGAVAISGGNTSIETGAGAYTVRISSANTSISNGYSFAGNVTSATITSQGATVTTLDDLVLGGSMKFSYVIQTDSATLTETSAAIVECSKNGAQEITLPSAVGNTGLFYLIKKTGTAGLVTVTTNAAETIDGSDGNTSIDAQYDYIGIVSNGTNWVITNRYIQ